MTKPRVLEQDRLFDWKKGATYAWKSPFPLAQTPRLARLAEVTPLPLPSTAASA